MEWISDQECQGKAPTITTHMGVIPLRSGKILTREVYLVGGITVMLPAYQNTSQPLGEVTEGIV